MTFHQPATLIYESRVSRIYYQPVDAFDRPRVIKVLLADPLSPDHLAGLNSEYELTRYLSRAACTRL